MHFDEGINLGIWFLYTLLGFGFGFFSCSKIMNIQMSFMGISREDVTGVGEYFKAYDFCLFLCDMILVCAFKFYNKQTYWCEYLLQYNQRQTTNVMNNTEY